MQILLSAGEASGETYGAQLIEALRRIRPNAKFFGMGGERMRAAGCELLVDAREVAVVGLVEVLTRLPRIRNRFRQLVTQAEKRRPDAAVQIDRRLDDPLPRLCLLLRAPLQRVGSCHAAPFDCTIECIQY